MAPREQHEGNSGGLAPRMKTCKWLFLQCFRVKHMVGWSCSDQNGSRCLILKWDAGVALVPPLVARTSAGRFLDCRRGGRRCLAPVRYRPNAASSSRGLLLGTPLSSAHSPDEDRRRGPDRERRPRLVVGWRHETGMPRRVDDEVSVMKHHSDCTSNSQSASGSS